MVDYLPRSAWGARAPRSGPGLLTVSRVIGAVIHWPGSSERDSFDSSAEVAAALRGWQAYHMDSRGWSDIAYQVAVDQAGRAWTLRGLRTQSGANGNNELNESYGAILLVLIAGEQPSAAMKATVRGVIADFRRIYPKGFAIRPHSAVRPDGTDCPGDAARAAIARGDFTPGTTITPEDDMPTPAEIAEAVWAKATTNTIDGKPVTALNLLRYSHGDISHLQADVTSLDIKQAARYSRFEDLFALVRQGIDASSQEELDALAAESRLENSRFLELVALVKELDDDVAPAAALPKA